MTDDERRARPPDLAVFRYQAMTAGAMLFVVIAFAVFVSVPIALSRHDVAGHVIVPLVASAVSVMEWLAFIATAVRVRADGLVIENWIVRNVIPWERFAGLRVETGQGMYACLDDGRVVKSAAFGRNLADAMRSYASMRATLARIQASCQQARAAHTPVDPAPPYRRQIRLPWPAALISLAFFEAVSWLAFAAHGG